LINYRTKYNNKKMFGKQQFVGKVEGSITDKYDLIKVFCLFSIINLNVKRIFFFNFVLNERQ